MAVADLLFGLSVFVFLYLIHEVIDNGLQSLCENWRSSNTYSCNGNTFELKELKCIGCLIGWEYKRIWTNYNSHETGTTADPEGCPALSLGVSLFRWGYPKQLWMSRAQSVPKWKKENYLNTYFLISHLNYFFFFWLLKIFRFIFWTLWLKTETISD